MPASTLEDHYPITCPFCKIAAAYPATSTSPIPSSPDPEKVDPQCHLLLSTPHVLAFLDILPIAPGHILLTTRRHYRTLGDMHGTANNGDGEEDGKRREKVDLKAQQRDDARALGEWMPLLSRALCRVTGIEDWNIVQNNGERAAQVVPHVHFHFIPRYQEGTGRDVSGNGKAGAIGGGGNGRLGKLDMGMLKSWRMFGRGTREELDDDEGVVLAGKLREALEREIRGEDQGNWDDGRAKAKL